MAHTRKTPVALVCARTPVHVDHSLRVFRSWPLDSFGIESLIVVRRTLSDRFPMERPY